MRKHLMVAAITLGTTVAFSLPAQAATHGKSKLAAADSQTKTDTNTPSPKHYTVQSGDNLSKIAEAQGLDSWRPLWNANISIKDPDLVYPGEDLVIPEGTTTDRALPDGYNAQTLDSAYNAAAAANPRPTVHYGYRPASAAVYANGNVPDILNRTKMRESGGNYATNTGNGYYGAYQFDLGTWGNYDGYSRPDLAPPSVQDAKALDTYNRRGCSPWPNTCY